jgi:hypothetical protein
MEVQEVEPIMTEINNVIEEMVVEGIKVDNSIVETAVETAENVTDMIGCEMPTTLAESEEGKIFYLFISLYLSLTLSHSLSITKSISVLLTRTIARSSYRLHM